jgi:hypothetical protein
MLTMLLSQPASSAEIFDRVGSVGALFLQIQPDPRGEALGGAYSAVTRGVSGIYWNPAGLAFTSGIEIADQGVIADEIDWPADLCVSFEAISVSLGSLMSRLPIGTIGVWQSRLDHECRPDAMSKGFGTKEEAWGIAYAHRLTSSLGLGVTYKRIETDLSDARDRGHGFDLGGAFHQTVALSDRFEIEIGAAAGLRNLGSITMGEQHSTDLPRQGYLGLAPTLRAGHAWDWSFEVTLATELAYDDPRERWVHMGGIEFVLLDGLAARYGLYEAKGSERDDSWGLGVAARYGDIAGLAFDYAVTDLGIFGNVERFMLTIRFWGCTEGLDMRALSKGFRRD